MTQDVTATSTVYYDCTQFGRFVPYFDGTADRIDIIPGCEAAMTMATSGTGVVNNAQVADLYWSPVNHKHCVVTDGSGGGWASDSTSDARFESALRSTSEAI